MPERMQRPATRSQAPGSRAHQRRRSELGRGSFEQGTREKKLTRGRRSREKRHGENKNPRHARTGSSAWRGRRLKKGEERRGAGRDRQRWSSVAAEEEREQSSDGRCERRAVKKTPRGRERRDRGKERRSGRWISTGDERRPKKFPRPRAAIKYQRGKRRGDKAGRDFF
jgi:hypothetical protein